MIDKPSNNNITPLSSSSNDQRNYNQSGTVGEGNYNFNNLEIGDSSTPVQYNPNLHSLGKNETQLQEDLIKELEMIKLISSQNYAQNILQQNSKQHPRHSQNFYNAQTLSEQAAFIQQTFNPGPQRGFNYNQGFNNNYNMPMYNTQNMYQYTNNNQNYMINNRNQYHMNNSNNQGYSKPFKKIHNNYNQQPQQTPVDDLSIIQSLKYVSEKYPHLINLNTNNIGTLNQVKSQEGPKFFVIKSFTEEDIHKSIKYNCWSSTKEGNKKLTFNFIDTKKKNSEVYLFFSMNGSGRFVGVCRMMSEVDENIIFEYWAMDDVWKGLFQVEWIFVKDIPNKFFKDIKLPNNSFKPVTNSRDTQEIPRQEGERMIAIFEEFKFQTCLLQHFQYYDERQSLFETTKNNS